MSHFLDNVEIVTNGQLKKLPFCYAPADKAVLDDLDKTLHFHTRNHIERHERRASGQPDRAETNRLVKGPKSPTRKKQAIARLYYRKWANEYRIRVESSAGYPETPKGQSGQRLTEKLTYTAQRKIIESGAYVSACKGGFKTFATLTLKPEARVRVSSGETTLGKEFSRFADAINKIKQRGFESGDTTIKGQKGPIVYVWVAEAPHVKHEKTGLLDYTQQNYHIHLLMDWAIEPEHFKAWAERIEKAWQHGFVKLEKIRNQKAASHYLLKALGYMTKGGANTHFYAAKNEPKIVPAFNEETGEHYCDYEKTNEKIELIPSQGAIAGNRYGISKDARAPAWECVAAFEAERMGQIVFETGQELKIRQSKMLKAIKDNKDQQKHGAALKARANNYKNPEAKKKTLAKAEELLKKANAAASKLFDKKLKQPVGHKFQITFKGLEQVESFLQMAVTHRGWKVNIASYLTHFKLDEGAAWLKNRISQTLENAKTDMERYWQAVLTQGEPQATGGI